jgi:fido (protein-threonine AMPylation protein)
MKYLDFNKYYEAPEPGRRERAYGWATAIGLQDVDGLKPSQYLINTAKRHIEGEISQEDARRLVDEYYETKEGHDLPSDVQEADKVSARMVAVINSPTFNFSVAYYLGLHRQIFDGVFKFAGEIRSVELTKREWVLNGDSVQYTPSCMIKDTLEYDFDRERKFKYKGLSEDRFVEHFAAFISGIWQIHPFREGNTRTAALFAIKYLRSRGYSVTNDLFAEKSYYFRNALVRANYENDRLDVEKTLLPLEEFFKVLLYGDEIELHNRFLKIGQEYGSPAAKAIADLHRHDDVINDVVNWPDVGINCQNDGINDGINSSNDGINDGIKYTLTETEENAVKAILRDSHITATVLSGVLSVKKRQAERIIASLKKKAGLKRRGARKNGEWYFEGVAKTMRRS